MTEKPSRNEEEYFALREAELLRERHKAAERARREEERKRHYMKCPECGADLAKEHFREITLDRCSACRGVWLDASLAESLINAEAGTASALFRSLIRGVRTT